LLVIERGKPRKEKGEKERKSKRGTRNNTRRRKNLISEIGKRNSVVY
jgi:hypothetical protein